MADSNSCYASGHVGEKTLFSARSELRVNSANFEVGENDQIIREK